MKNPLVLSIIVLSTLVFSCSKSNNPNSNSTTMSFTFTAKNISYSFPIASFTKGSPGLYYLNASDHNTNNLRFIITTDTLIKNIFTNQTADFTVDSLTYGFVGSWIVSITNIHNGLVDGTFSGYEDYVLTGSAIPPLIITDGVFKNVIINP